MTVEDKSTDELRKELVAIRQLNTLLLLSAAKHQQRLEKELQEERLFSATLLDTTDGLVRNFVAALLDTTNALVVVFDLQGRIVGFNSTCELLTGYFFEEVKGKLVWDLFVTSTEAIAIKAMFASLQSGEVLSEYESDWVIRDGSRRRISWSNKLLRDERGEVNYLVSIGVDVTERTVAESELQQYKQNLEQIVAVRTSELTQVNQQLQMEIAERQRVEEELRQQSLRERLIGLISQRILGSLNLDEIIHTAVEQVRDFLAVERVTIYQVQPGEDGKFVVESIAPGISSVLGVDIQDFCIDKRYLLTYQHGQVAAIDDVNNANIQPCYSEFLNKINVQANLVVPILANQQIWGLLCVHQCSAPRHWEPWEINFLSSLATQLAIAIQQSQLYQQLQLANIELQRKAHQDGLTQLSNRRHFDEYLNSEWLRAAREKVSLSLILCDIDFFKTYNDTYGHIAGDMCLQQVAKAISRAVKRPADLVARYGGEEFAVIMPNTDSNGAIHIAELIRSEVKGLKIFHNNCSLKPYVTLSVGVASTIPDRASEPAALIADADEALYFAKASGRDRVVLKTLS
jgi:diguanylate cyclase (GGDEF)-like protein/PAS domain S-box-containing protein